MAFQCLLITAFPDTSGLQTVQEAVKAIGELMTTNEQDLAAHLRQRHYDLVLLDVSSLINVDPAGMINTIHTTSSRLPVIVLTTSPTWRRAREAFQAGAAEYIQKSMNLDEMQQIFQSTIMQASGPWRHTPLKETPAMKHTILFADNNADFLRSRKEFIENEGYTVITANDPNTARQQLVKGSIHVAILDQRLLDDNDPTDESGLYLAKEFAQSLPTIVLTNYPTYEQARSALKVPGVASYIAKFEKVDILLAAIKAALSSQRVFIVHGHDEEAKEKVARLVERFGLRTVILRDEVNSGSTIIEKLEEYGEVDFAIVLLTPDDVGASKTNQSRPQPRARQNVIFELGYFVGRLGRKRVAALYKDELETPSDYHGVVYTKMDPDDAWRLKLAKEMRAAGLNIDLNSL